MKRRGVRSYINQFKQSAPLLMPGPSGRGKKEKPRIGGVGETQHSTATENERMEKIDEPEALQYAKGPHEKKPNECFFCSSGKGSRSGHGKEGETATP